MQIQINEHIQQEIFKQQEIFNMEEKVTLVVKGVYTPEAYKEALDNVTIPFEDNQKKAVKQLSRAIGISASDIVKAIKYFVYDRGLIITNHQSQGEAL